MRRYTPDILLLALLFILPLVMFWPQTVGGSTLLPIENLYQYEPFASYRAQVGAPEPHNALVSDLILQNYQWKQFIRTSISAGEVPLWNPYQFSGIPFMAAGQQSTLYPFSLLYYALPLTAAYGWFTVAQLWLAGAGMYVLLRGLGTGHFGAALAGITYQLAAFFVISAVFPMIIAAAAWLPLLLLMIEFIIRQRPLLGRPTSLPWAVIGAVALGCNILAGHIEITYYTLLLMGFYAAARLLSLIRLRQALLQRSIWLIALVAAGLMLGAVQFIPLFELANQNFRSGSASYDEVISWAHPLRNVIQFILPNFYGNPTHHTYFDLFAGQTVPVTVNAYGEAISHTDWGMKNYVEGALYVGLLPLALALYAALHIARSDKHRTPTLIFSVITLLGLSLMFGLPTYRLLYMLPGIDQLHSPFRWVYAVTLGVAVLAGFGADYLVRESINEKRRVWFSRVLLAIGALTLVGLLISRLLFDQIAPLIDWILANMATPSGQPAGARFADAAMFYSYQFPNVLIFGAMTLGAGIVLWWSSHPTTFTLRGIPLWQMLAIPLVAADLMIASWGFNAASDPALLDFTPPAITWLQSQPGHWRYTTLDDPTQPPLMNANMGWRYGLRDVRGYDSIIPRAYVDYMTQIAPQTQLEFNRVAPFYTTYHTDFDVADALNSPLLAALSVRYLITHADTDLSVQPTLSETWTRTYSDEAVSIWENSAALPFVYLRDDAGNTLNAEISIVEDTGREKLLHVRTDAAGLLVISEMWIPGWRAFIRPADSGEDAEIPLDVIAVDDVLQGVPLALPDTESVTTDWLLRVVYSPSGFQVGMFISFIGGVLLIFALGIWLWRLFVAPDEGSTISRVARNSIAPILLNLFNRGIDFAFAFVMLRILGPEDSGIYFYAGLIFVWFDIFTNFGLDIYLTREVARDRSRAARFFFSTSALRFILTFVGIVLLAGFLFTRQTLIEPPLSQHGVIAIILLYIGLFPSSLSKGMTSLFYAFEKAEYPAAITTVATISKVVLGLAALIMGYGVIGLAGVSIITNLLTLGILLWGGRKLLGAWERPDSGLMRYMVGESWPLMLNHFLATIFFQIDVLIMEAIHGARMVGMYSVAYKWVVAVNIIPAFFTQAMLPVMSRQAHEDREALRRTYRLSVKLLVSMALPLAVLFTVLAWFLTEVLGGAQYLPDGAIATQLMIWSIPIGWINSLTQYVLIALDLQRHITRAFILAVMFNIIANVTLIPDYGYQAAAITTILSEMILLLPFARLLYGALGAIHWRDILWRPIVATAAMLIIIMLLWELHPVVGIVAGLGGYAGVLLALHPLDAHEMSQLVPLLPGRLRRLLA